MDNTIVYCSDGNDYKNLEMSAFSVKKFLGDSVRIVLLTQSDNVPRIQGIDMINPIPILENVGIHNRGWNRNWPFSVLYRLAIPFIQTFSGMDRILYLDTDTLIRSIAAMEIFDVPIYDYEIIGSYDGYQQARKKYVMKNDIDKKTFDELKTTLWDKRGYSCMAYVNAGVNIWCVNNIIKNGLEWYKKRLKWFWDGETTGKFYFLDQDFINSMMDVLPILNNEFNYFGGDINSECSIQHFVGKACKNSMINVAHSIGYVQ